MDFGSLFGGMQSVYPKWMQQGGKSLWEQYGAMSDQAYGAGALRRNTANYAENFDRSLANYGAQQGRSMGQKGFSGGGPNLGLIRSGAMADYRSDEAGRLEQERLMAILRRHGMLTGMQGLYSKQYQPGIGGALGSIMGGGGFGNLFGGGGGGAASVPTTPPWENPINPKPGLNY